MFSAPAAALTLVDRIALEILGLFDVVVTVKPGVLPCTMAPASPPTKPRRVVGCPRS